MAHPHIIILHKEAQDADTGDRKRILRSPRETLKDRDPTTGKGVAGLINLDVSDAIDSLLGRARQAPGRRKGSPYCTQSMHPDGKTAEDLSAPGGSKFERSPRLAGSDMTARLQAPTALSEPLTATPGQHANQGPGMTTPTSAESTPAQSLSTTTVSTAQFLSTTKPPPGSPAILIPLAKSFEAWPARRNILPAFNIIKEDAHVFAPAARRACPR